MSSLTLGSGLAIALTKIDTVTAMMMITSEAVTAFASAAPSIQSRRVMNTTSAEWPTWTDYLYGPTTGPEAAAVTCNALQMEFTERFYALISRGPTGTTINTHIITSREGACETYTSGERWTDKHIGPITTLCDGVARAQGPRESITYYSPGTRACSELLITSTVSSPLYSSYSGTQPTCTVAASDCTNIFRTYSSRSSEYGAPNGTVTIKPLYPICTVSRTRRRPPRIAARPATSGLAM